MAADETGAQLHACLALDLPEGCQFTIYHISTPPSRVPAIYARAPGQHEDETYCETHFLSVFIERDDSLLLVFAIEILVYTTKYLTTLFVSKADSTGYLYLLGLPKDTPSPLRVICTTFLNWLRFSRSRRDRRLVLSLFARAQDQYLFPGSKENSHKHILDDRGLIKWWCKVIDPILDVCVGKGGETARRALGSAYLRVPGFNKYETRVFLPQTGSSEQNQYERSWTVGDPLETLARSAGLPERCLIPRFPDDPKARFLLDLDDELPEAETKTEPPVGAEGQVLAPHNEVGRWRSVKSLEQFWDTMSYRQECAAGRLVGFLWAVFTPAEVTSSAEELGWVYVEPPALKTVEASDLPKEETDHYFWPVWSRGKAVLSVDDYSKMNASLLAGDYATEEVARESSRDLIKVIEGMSSFRVARLVVGSNKKKGMVQAPQVKEVPMMLTSSLIKKKKRPVEETRSDAKPVEPASSLDPVPGSSPRKKPKSN